MKKSILSFNLFVVFLFFKSLPVLSQGPQFTIHPVDLNIPGISCVKVFDLSPDGKWLVYAAKEGNELGLWIMMASGGRSIPIAVTHPGHNEAANWSPDGKRIAFTSTRSGNFDVWIMDVDINKIEKELNAKPTEAPTLKKK